MKKIFLVMAAICLVFVSCNNKPAEPAAQEAVAQDSCQHKHHGCSMTEEQKAMFAQWKQFETLEAEAQVELIAAMKAFVGERMEKHEGCKGEKHEGCQGEKHEGCQGEKHEGCEKKCEGEKHEGCQGEKHEGCEKKCEGEKEGGCAQKHAEIMEKWNNFETLAIEEQKAVLDHLLDCQKKHARKHEGCKGEKHEGCQGEKHEGCQGHKHEGCGKH